MTVMMKIAALGIVGSILVLVLKDQKSQLALCIGILTAVGICLLVVPELSAVVSYINRMYSAVCGEDAHFAALMKVTGITVVTKISADVCKDAGQQAAASAVNLAGKILCISLCLPQVGAVFQLLVNLIPAR